MENTAFIGLGSNLGDRAEYLRKAIVHLENHKQIHVVNNSSIYETEPIGYLEQDKFLNLVIQITTGLNPHELLDACLNIEQLLGRKREILWGPRTIDLDILLYNQENIETEKLIIPHPRIQERAFVLIPLVEVGRNSMPPVVDIQMLECWLEGLSDKEGVRIWKQKNGEDVFALFES
ncbi:2-amino-4-hydroxy-6-hydroxymethyldihydropteridine diphosphokinase [Bacillus sp. V3-13]|uniref:2-amino-4-hydroxy-6- hydroxymethyldihydropteridine diphosphokinase n=1 Tax=Bacillus sp. V3-13 TaxID=2053728 RepID=UPI000C755A8F|nr:2-amino-4-hydroxy-6-hydroxymethyldihydropteridine diphosphokinase [Bacillus sp. V3-13]PLR78912.1 2-amino-4-hydroxy-6-hydroxymethyldihydropteridine diphosphokinase [Bacillus sp. V3-13]